MNKILTAKILVLAFTISLGAPAIADEVADAAAIGKAKFVLCGACHGLDGKGMEPVPGTKMAPSFFDSKLLKLDAEITAIILFKGIKKEDPAAYMGQLMLPLGATMPDEDVANLITYVRSEFGGVKELTTPAQVAEWRKKHAATPQPTRGELQKMGAKEDSGTPKKENAAAAEPKKEA